MHETKRLLAALAACRARGTGAVLATLARVRGSHYRKAGARMLLALDGELTGVLSGGCLEGDLLERARRVDADGTPEVVRYDLTATGEALWGFGLGCSGEVEVLLEPLPAAGDGPLAPHRHVLERRCRGALATVVGVRGEVAAILGERLALTADGTSFECTATDPAVLAALHAAATAALADDADPAASADDSARTLDLALPAGGIAVLVEPMAPPIALLLCGTGRDAVPVLRLAGELGWEVTVVDPRAAPATAERFAGAERVLAGPPPAWLAEARSILGQLGASVGRAAVAPEAPFAPGSGDGAAAVAPPRPAVAIVMTHAYLDDLALLEALLDLPLAYVGLLGPTARRDRLLADLAARGRSLTPAERARLRGPAGLDIGSRTPEEIALALLAEARAALAGRQGGPLDTAGGGLGREP